MTKNEQSRFEWLLKNPSTAMLEMGSLASGYDLSQEDAGKIWKAMADHLLVELEQRKNDLAQNIHS